MTDNVSISTRYRAAVDAHKDLVYAAALRQLRDPASADDATQAVFLVLLKKLPTLPETRPLAPWLLTVTRHVCNDGRKRDRRRRLHEQRSAMRTPQESTLSTDPHLQQAIDGALAALSKNERDVLTLRFLQQLDIPAVAAALHITESNAKKRITRALASLRDYFKRHEFNLSTTAATTLLTHAAIIHAPPHLATTLTTLTTQTASTAALTMARAATQKLVFASLKLPTIVTALLAISAATAVLTNAPHLAPQSPLAPVAASATAPVFTATLHQPQGRGWVHVHWDVGQLLDEWQNLQTGESFIVRRDGDVYVENQPQRWELSYSTAEGVIDKKTSNDAQPWKFVTAAEMWPFPTQFITPTADARQPATSQPATLRYADSLRSVSAFRFDQYGTDMYGKIHLFDRFWRDAKTNNPLMWKRLLSQSERQESGRDTETATFDYPETGPASLYELGVPRDTPIHSFTPSPKEVQQILDAINDQYAKFPAHFCAITMAAGSVLPRAGNNPDTIQHLEILWVSGDEILARGYSPDRSLSPIATADQILDWVSRHGPVVQRLKTKTLSYEWRRNAGEKPTIQAKRTSSFSSPSHIPAMQWPMYNMTTNFTLLPQTSDTPEGCIGLHYEGPNNWRADFFVDPHKDYLCLKQINYASRDGDFVPSQIITLDELHQVAGHWIAAEQIRHDFGNPDHNIYESESITIITYQPLAPADYPPNLFDPKPLLEGATRIGY